jgi:hypothetical protein
MTSIGIVPAVSSGLSNSQTVFFCWLKEQEREEREEKRKREKERKR